MSLNICCLNFEIRLISSQVISKKPFPVQTGSRFSATTIFCHYFYRTWVDTVWISKIRPIVIIWPKNLFLRAIFDLPGNTDCRFLKPKVVCLIPGRTKAFIIWILKIRAQLANHSLKHNHIIYYLNHWLSKRNICLITLFCFFIPFSTLYLFKNDSSFSRFVYLTDLPAASTMPNLEKSKNAHTLISINKNNTSVMWFVTRSSCIVCIKTVHLTIQDWYSWARVFFLSYLCDWFDWKTSSLNRLFQKKIF